MNIKVNTKRNFVLFITILMLGSALLTSLGPFAQSVSADAREPSSRILCRFEDGKMLANMHSTDYFFYLLRSKSAVTSTDSINSGWLNKMLTVSGYDFNSPNESVLGRPIRPSVIEPEDEADTENPDNPNDTSPKVSAFDRFGMSGLRWSSYQGEWRYNQVEACAKQDQISPTTYGAFYDDRLEPQSTYNEVGHSKDPRTIQFDKGLLSTIASGTGNTVANGLFSLSKVIVTLTIVFVGLAFTDITTLMGLTADGTAGTTAAGIFTELFNTVFSGFVVMAFVFTGVYLLYNVVFKRQVRLGISTLIKTVLIYVIAIVMATNPSFWVGVPNKVATYGQALVLNTMAGMYENGDPDSPTLCSTDIGSIDEGVNIDVNTDEETIMSEFEKVNINMRSLIGCQMWESLLFKPWVRGQFGVDYEDMASENIDNINSSWVGDASVPVGNGQAIDNWALFHLSTQTDAHSQVGDNNFPTLINGVNADWWRTVDALSNYDEEMSAEEGAEEQGYFNALVESEPTGVWQSWIGNNTTERIGVSILAIVFAIAGSIAPLIFSLSSAILGLGITLMMMTAPIFLLFGTWGGKGDSIFLGWLSALANTVIKRIAVSILLILSISITLTTMNMVYVIGIVKAFILMVLMSILLIKNKDKLLGIMASIDFGGAFDPRTKANQILDKTNDRAKTVGKVGLSSAAGARAGVKTGQGAFQGAKIGARSQLRNAMYQSPLGMEVVRELDIKQGHERRANHYCVKCHVVLGEEGREIAYRDDYGNYFCEYCAEELGLETLHEVITGVEADDYDEGPVSVRDTRTIEASVNESYMTHGEARNQMESKVVDGKYYWNNDKVNQMAKDNIESLREDILTFNNMKLQLGKTARPPSPPELLHEYIDIALINKAWTDGRMDVVEGTYKEAWKAWYQDNAPHVEGLEQKDIDRFKAEIEDYSPDVTPERSAELMRQYNKVPDEEKSDSVSDENLFVYRNGALVYNIYDNLEDRTNNKHIKRNSPIRMNGKIIGYMDDAEDDVKYNAEDIDVRDNTTPTIKRKDNTSTVVNDDIKTNVTPDTSFNNSNMRTNPNIKRKDGEVINKDSDTNNVIINKNDNLKGIDSATLNNKGLNNNNKGSYNDGNIKIDRNDEIKKGESKGGSSYHSDLSSETNTHRNNNLDRDNLDRDNNDLDNNTEDTNIDDNSNDLYTRKVNRDDKDKD